MESLQTLRRIKTKEIIARIQESDEWKSTLKTCDLEDVYWEVLSERHRPEFLTLLCYQFSMFGQATNHLALHISVEESLPRFKSLVELAIQKGITLVAIQRSTRRLLSGIITLDLLDDLLTDLQPASSSFLSLRGYINHQALCTLPPNIRGLLFDANMRPLKHIKYGQVICHDIAVVNPLIYKKKLGELHFVIMSLQQVYLGYSIAFGIVTNPFLQPLFRRIIPDHSASVDYSNLEFTLAFKDQDGVTLRNMQDVYTRLQTKYDFTQQYVESIKQRSKVLLYVQDFKSPTWWKNLDAQDGLRVNAVCIKFLPSDYSNINTNFNNNLQTISRSKL